MRIAIGLLIVTAAKPTMVPFEAGDLKLARTAVQLHARTHDTQSRRNVGRMIEELERYSWCLRFDLLCRGLPMDPPKQLPQRRAEEPFEAAIERMSPRIFIAWSKRLVLDEIIDQQVSAAGAERYAAALRFALHERGLPSPPTAATRPTSLLSEHPARVRAAS